MNAAEKLAKGIIANYDSHLRSSAIELPAHVESLLQSLGATTSDSGFTRGTNGEPAVLPSVRVVLHGSITKETESDTLGAFAIDGLPPGIYQIEANAPCLYADLAATVSAGASSTVPDEMNVAAVTSTTSPQLTWLKAMDSAFGRKVHHA